MTIQMKRSPYRKPKMVLVFSGSYVLTTIVRSGRQAASDFNINAQAISGACTGRYVSAGARYFRHLHPNVDINLTDDMDTLTVQEYDQMCKEDRSYYPPQEMTRRKKIRRTKLAKDERNGNDENE